MQRSVTPDQPSSQANPLPTPAESQPTKRQLAQRARRQRELAARLSASQFTTSEPIQPPTLRQHTQRTRHDKERANHAQDRDEQPVSITVNPLPTPMPTQSYPVNQHTRRGTRERTLRPAATSHILEPGDNQNSEVNQPNRRQVGQRLRRERERAARAAATGSAATSNQEASSITSGARLITPAPSQTLGGCARQTATGPSNLTNQLRELPSNPLTPPSTQRVNISCKLCIMQINVCFLIILLQITLLNQPLAFVGLSNKLQGYSWLRDAPTSNRDPAMTWDTWTLSASIVRLSIGSMKAQ